MFDTATRRLLKDIIIYLDHQIPETIHYPAYYFPWDNKTFEELDAGVELIRRLEHFPWPDVPCIVFAHDAFAEMCYDKPPHCLVACVHDGSRAVVSLDYGRETFADKYHLIAAIQLETGQVALHHSIRLLYRTDDVPGRYDHAANVLLRSEAIGRPLTLSEQGRMRKHGQAYYKNRSGLCWYEGRFLEDGARMDTRPSYLPESLINIATPCHYFVRSRFKNGFGSQRLRRATSTKAIFSAVRYERLHSIWPPDARGDTPPHFRRGHVRYYWKRAGLDRFALPRTPGDRVALVQRRNVESVYVTPAWVGVSAWDEGDIEHEIILGRVRRQGLRLLLPENN